MAKENYDYDVICVCANVGQGNELDGLEERAKLSGASYGPLSPRSRLVQNVADAKLVRNLVKHRRFSIGSIGP